jgi:hypothetical protein
VKPRRYPIALNLPDAVSQLLVYGRYVVERVKTSDWFPDPDPPLDEVSLHLDQLEASEVIAQSRAHGAASARDLDKSIVIGDMFALKAYVRRIITANPGHAGTIAEAAGMWLKRYTPRAKPPLSATLGPGPDEILVEGRAAKRRHSGYTWQVSTDGGLTWTTFTTGNWAHVIFRGTVPGTTYWFRYAVVVGNTTGPWSSIDVYVTVP